MKIGIITGTIILCAAGCMFAAHQGFHGFSLDPKIKPYEILNLTVTIIIAIFIQYHFAGKSRDSRVEKDIIIADIKEVIKELRSLRDTTMAHFDGKAISAPEKRRILGALRHISNELLNVEFVVETSNCSDVCENCRLLQNSLRTYKMAVTGGKFPEGYSQSDIPAQQKAYKELHRGLHTMLFEVNKHK
jgi:hypothetical protein